MVAPTGSKKMRNTKLSKRSKRASVHQLLHAAMLGGVEPAEALRRHLESSGAAAFRYYDRALRSRELYAELGFSLTAFSEIVRTSASAFSPPVWCCLSMQRDGFLRQRAIRELAASPGRFALAAILNRTNDPVREVADAALSVLPARVACDPLEQLVWVLPLVDRVALTPRGSELQIATCLDPRLTADLKATRSALEQAASATDSRLRMSALQHYFRLGPDATLPSWLSRALQDTSPPIRLWAAHAAIASTAPDQLEPLLLLMAHNRSPSLRLLALRAYRRRGLKARVADACFDPNANVRFYARRYLKRFGEKLDHRPRALELLTRGDAQTSQLIGALAVLSELGLREDRALVLSFTEHARGRVAAEARRTLELLPDA